MSLVARFELILVLLAATIVLDRAAKALRIPPAAALLVGGLVLALIPGLPEIALDPDLTLVLFLPPLLVAGAYFTAWRDFRADLRIILQLAIGAVLFTTAAVGVVAHLMVPGLPWAACFALGAIVSPPDAVAAKAVLHGLPLPARVVPLLEGESLVNDASGLVLYRFAVAAALIGAFDAGDAALQFAILSVGGVAAGIAAGVAATMLIPRLKQPELQTLASLLIAWATYIGAERLGVSGVLAAVACGLRFGWRQHSVLTAATRIQAKAFWDVIVFVMESLVFILIGLSLRGVAQRLAESDSRALLPAIAAIVAAVVVSRFLWIFPATYVPRALFAPLRRRDPHPPLAIPLVMSWAGMRGVVSLAAALALPEGFPGRDLILATTFAVILVTVLLQGGTLAPLIRALKLGGFTTARKTLSESTARARIGAAQLAAVQSRSRGEDGSERHPRLVEQYGYRARAAARFDEAGGSLAPDRAEHFAAVLDAIAAGRAELLRLHAGAEIHDEVLHTLEQELDLEELSARRFAGEEG